MCTDKQAWLIYYEIYADPVDKETGKAEATKSQEMMRQHLAERNGWDETSIGTILVEEIKKRLTIAQAKYVIDLLKAYDWRKAEEILTNNIKPMTFLPKGYEPPTSGGKYIKLQNGENKIRIMSSAITGYIYWTNDDKPVRSALYPTNTPNIRKDETGKSKIQHFWAFVVWDYADGGAIKIMEVTQASIREALLNLVNDADWGDPKKYDIKITKTGQKIETRYQVSPVPHKDAPAEALTEYAGMNINLKALYSGGDPFGESSEITVDDIPLI